MSKVVKIASKGKEEVTRTVRKSLSGITLRYAGLCQCHATLIKTPESRKDLNLKQPPDKSEFVYVLTLSYHQTLRIVYQYIIALDNNHVSWHDLRLIKTQ